MEMIPSTLHAGGDVKPVLLSIPSYASPSASFFRHSTIVEAKQGTFAFVSPEMTRAEEGCKGITPPEEPRRRHNLPRHTTDEPLGGAAPVFVLMERRPAAARGKRAYDNFVPSHEVKEHIRIQINDFGRLKISGERPVADNLWTKFEDGLLYIIKPILQTKPSTDGEAGKAPETTPDRRGTTEKKGDDGENGVSQKSKPKRKESIEKERDRIEGPKYGGRNGRRMTGRRKEAVTAEPTSPGRFYRRKQLVLNAAIAMVILVGVVWLFVCNPFDEEVHPCRSIALHLEVQQVRFQDALDRAA
ncbi:hypothetical protein MUK42_25863 [Musa troglodytarum]|uniref:SHSP domain-containing protein n=1 Tax=Musa troglodytarum TaxID=320322 RepID=A0A9E7EI11_9LILI|nr:hypothetical protein MUK42_25863 [Musa troglodytarum]